MTSIFEDFVSIFRDDFEHGVEETSNSPVIYLDPNEFDLEHYDNTGNVHPDDIQKARDMFQEQGIDTTKATDGQVRAIIVQSLTRGPFAAGNVTLDTVGGGSDDFCVVNKPLDELDHKNEIIPLFSAQDLEDIQEIPGWDDHWDRVIGIHEGTHCNQNMSTAGMTQAQEEMAVLGWEAEADQAAIDWLRENGKDDMAQAIIDYRILAVAEFPNVHADHATTLLIDKPGVAPTPDMMDALKTFPAEMDRVVANDLGITPSEARQMFETDPEAYIGNVDRLLNEGGFDGHSNPHMKESIEAYSGAYRRQVIETEPAPPRHGPPGKSFPRHGALESEDTGTHFASLDDSVIEAASFETAALVNGADVNGADSAPETTPSRFADMDLSDIDGGAPVVTLADGDQAKIQIGGVEPSAFFASHADEGLATQRIELAQQQASIGIEFDTTGTPAVSTAQQQFA